MNNSTHAVWCDLYLCGQYTLRSACEGKQSYKTAFPSPPSAPAPGAFSWRVFWRRVRSEGTLRVHLMPGYLILPIKGD